MRGPTTPSTGRRKNSASVKAALGSLGKQGVRVNFFALGPNDGDAH
jgi:hypothetical protein